VILALMEAYSHEQSALDPLPKSTRCNRDQYPGGHFFLAECHSHLLEAIKEDMAQLRNVGTFESCNGVQMLLRSGHHIDETCARRNSTCMPLVVIGEICGDSDPSMKFLDPSTRDGVPYFLPYFCPKEASRLLA